MCIRTTVIFLFLGCDMPSCGCEPHHVGSLQKVYSSVSDPSWKGETYFGCIYVQSSLYTNKVS